jgi:hypothetical protein
LIAAVLSVACAGDASAITGAELQDSCRPINMVHGTRSYAQFGNMSQCIGYIVGVSDLTIISTLPEPLICRPREVTDGNVAQVVLAYLDRHPSDLHLEAVFFVTYALMQAYPCPASK